MIQIDEEDKIITETSHTMRSGHCDNEGEYIINKSVKGLIHECSPRKRRYRSQSVVYEQLWQHEEESKRIYTIDDAVKQP